MTSIGVSTFFAAIHATDSCGANGLPLTPNSINILGRFQTLKELTHPNLCQYIDLKRSKHERLLVVSEHYNINLAKELKSGKFSGNNTKFLQISYQILQGLNFAHQYGISHINLCLENVKLDSKENVKLANFGLYYISGSGKDVSFPIGCLRYFSPEILLYGLQATNSTTEKVVGKHKIGSKSDIWSLGILLLELYIGEHLWPKHSIKQLLAKIILLGKYAKTEHPFETIIRENNILKKIKNMPEDLLTLIKDCLSMPPLKRPNTEDLLQSKVFLSLCSVPTFVCEEDLSPFNINRTQCLSLTLPYFNILDESCGEKYNLEKLDIRKLYHLWNLAGGDLEGELKKHGLIKAQPPICGMPDLVTSHCDTYGLVRDRSHLWDDTVVMLPQDQIKAKLDTSDINILYPLLEKIIGLEKDLSDPVEKIVELPIVIREKDVEYQFFRMILYQRLLNAYPYKWEDIWKEARVDIPPPIRAHVWATLLGVNTIDVQEEYNKIDKITPTLTDRQIEVDIPRCHQYDELLLSPTAHRKFKRILKAWVISHPEFVYWQGLDSLSAPFLYLNFNNEALAYACLSKFIPKYLNMFFLKDNSKIIQEYLAVFSHLIAFHEPELSDHMDSIGFIPELYAIPWFLTMFAHVFPLHKIFHLWDTLLLGNSSLPLCIGVAILKQLRDSLLSYGFNECILLFSDMPEIDIQQCVQDSIHIFCCTPKSATFRQSALKQNTNVFSASNQSYYNTEQNGPKMSELAQDPITLEELKSEKCPRISPEDLIELCELQGHEHPRSPTKKHKTIKPKILIVDVRNSDDFIRGHILNSINIPFSQAFNAEGGLCMTSSVGILYQNRGRVITVVGSREKAASNFSNVLVHLGFPKVCIMHGGIECLKQTGILTVAAVNDINL